jgi:hypothetical protein
MMQEDDEPASFLVRGAPTLRQLGHCMYAAPNGTAFSLTAFPVPNPDFYKKAMDLIRKREAEYDNPSFRKKNRVPWFDVEDGQLEAFRFLRGYDVEPRTRTSIIELYRARYLLRWLQKHAEALGPSLLRGGGWQVFQSLDQVATEALGMSGATLQQEICPELRERIALYQKEGTRFNLSMQQLEWLQPTWENAISAHEFGQGIVVPGFSPQELKFYAFSLMWFLMVSGAKDTGLVHHNLTPENIRMRPLQNAATVFRFDWTHNEESTAPYTWNFVASAVPVIIGFEHATVNVTHRMSRYAIGAYSAAPPEALCVALYRDTHRINLFQKKLQDKVDWSVEVWFGGRAPTPQSGDGVRALPMRWLQLLETRKRSTGYDQWSLGRQLLLQLGVRLPDLNRPTTIATLARKYAENVIALFGKRQVLVSQAIRQGNLLEYFFINTLITCCVFQNKQLPQLALQILPKRLLRLHGPLFQQGLNECADLRADIRRAHIVPFLPLLRHLMTFAFVARTHTDWLDLDIWKEFSKPDEAMDTWSDVHTKWNPNTPVPFSEEDQSELQSKLPDVVAAATAALICGQCGRPNARSACGYDCGRVVYCNQNCANAHWERHACQ